MKRVLIVEDLKECRKWLGRIVRAAFPGCRIREAVNVREGLAAAEGPGFDLVLIDLGLPDGCGFDVLRRFRAYCPETLCVITTVVGDDAHIVAALASGAGGYLLKDQPEEVLSEQLRQLENGVPALSPSIARRIMDHFRLTGPSATCDTDLSEREKEVLALISRGLRNIDVAANLGIAVSTVATHIKSIYRKLGISSRAEASWQATRLGL